MKLEDAPKAYDMFRKKEGKCVKVVLTPKPSIISPALKTAIGIWWFLMQDYTNSI